jgi:hypothetical protein
MFQDGRVRLIDPSLRVRVAKILAVLDAHQARSILLALEIACADYRRPGGSLVCHRKRKLANYLPLRRRKR